MDHLYKVNEDDLLFPVSKSYLHHEMLRGCKLSGVKVIRIHDLRHSHITMLIENGYSAKDVGSRAGHSAERITFKYAHAYAEKGSKRVIEHILKDPIFNDTISLSIGSVSFYI